MPENYGRVTLARLLELSHKYWDREQMPDKRGKQIDILSARITGRHNFEYDKETKEWKKGDDSAKIEFLIKTDPITYKKKDTVKPHKYPITILLKELDKGFLSPVRLRCGSENFPVKSKKTPPNAPKHIKDRIRQENLDILERNLLYGIEFDFLYNLEYVYAKYGCLYGINRTRKPPRESNPSMKLALCKHLYYVVLKILLPLFRDENKEILKKKIFENSLRTR